MNFFSCFTTKSKASDSKTKPAPQDKHLVPPNKN